MHKYLAPLLERVQNGDIDPSYVISHRLPLAEAPRGYEIFKHKQENCTKIVLDPHAAFSPPTEKREMATATV